jgi:FAD/FMN-containing dehydrogenase
VHLNILKPADLDAADFFEKCATVSSGVFEIVQRHEGSVSAEHGVGLLKKPYLQYSRSKTEIAAMRAVKAIFDPANILNPGKLI